MDRFLHFNSASDNIASYLERLDAAFVLHDVAVPARQIKWLQILLGPEGEGLFNEVSEDSTYEEYKNIVRTALGPHDELASARIQLNSIECENNDFRKLCRSIRTLSAKIYAHCPPRLKQLAEVDAFIRAMPPPIKAHLSLNKYTSLNDVHDAASLKLAAMSLDIRAVSSTTPSPSDSSVHINAIRDPRLDEVISSLSELSEVVKSLSNKPQQAPQPQPLVLPIPTYTPQQQSRRGGARGRGSGRQNNSGRQVTCYNCRGVGHYANVCPSDRLPTNTSASPSNAESLN